MTLLRTAALALALTFAACTETAAPPVKNNPPVAGDDIIKPVAKLDKFTYANYDQVQMTHLDLDLDVRFDKKVLDGVATIDFKKLQPDANELVLDTRDLTLRKVDIFDGEWKPATYAPVSYTHLTLPTTPYV